MEQEQNKVTWKQRFSQIGSTIGNGALNFGKGALNVLSPLAQSLPSKTPGANTIAEEQARANRGVISGALDKTLWGKAINILDGVGGATLGRTSATETGNFVTDGLNGFVSSMPILSTALAPLGKTIDVYQSDRQKRSQSFNRQSTAMKNNGANVLFNGNALQAEGNLESIRNVQAEQTLKQGDLDNAADAQAVWHRQDMKLRGGPNRVNNFGVTGGKQGTVLQFTRRTLSKSKIKKQQSDKPEEVIIQEPINEQVDSFKEGGKVNVIPSGALHAHKHNLTEIAEDGEKFEDVTTKGIPVVVEDEKGNLIQQAEVEREEIIFRLEVTKKLEELMNQGTDKAAIEAGKILVYEILENTKDNTGEML